MTRNTPRLTLFVTGHAPRSQRARTNLAAALQEFDVIERLVEEVDLLAGAKVALDNGIFASPALMDGEVSESRVMYGDLSDADNLTAFLMRAFGMTEPKQPE